MGEKSQFDIELVKGYPRANRKIGLEVSLYGLTPDLDQVSIEMVNPQYLGEKGHTTFISPFGLEFQVPKNYPDGTLLKINVSLPDYWVRKQRFVEYSRIDTPDEFKILAKVVKTEDIGKRGKRKLILCQTVNIDEVDEQVLKSYLQETK